MKSKLLLSIVLTGIVGLLIVNNGLELFGQVKAQELPDDYSLFWGTPGDEEREMLRNIVLLTAEECAQINDNLAPLIGSVRLGYQQEGEVGFCYFLGEPGVVEGAVIANDMHLWGSFSVVRHKLSRPVFDTNTKREKLADWYRHDLTKSENTQAEVRVVDLPDKHGFAILQNQSRYRDSGEVTGNYVMASTILNVGGCFVFFKVEVDYNQFNDWSPANARVLQGVNLVGDAIKEAVTPFCYSFNGQEYTDPSSPSLPGIAAELFPTLGITRNVFMAGGVVVVVTGAGIVVFKLFRKKK